ncbi:MAG: hypothetical protein KKD83_09145 [Chloroflexi bacterium]|nr:hypothetical protein [Chloroflexota bacterium]
MANKAQLLNDLPPVVIEVAETIGVTDLPQITALAQRAGDIRLTITGLLGDGCRFTGDDLIKVINPGK